ncbi:MAG: hypothetical protein HY291_00415 [Planctomycetes bacterium]|nr:hypothetical protein [Planctomycetota bacterium]
MPALEAERIGETLWIVGNVDRSMEKDLTTALEKFVQDVPAAKQIVDMTNVAYFASSAAKVLIGVAQDVETKGAKLKVRSSMPVVQTLNLLGAKSWLEIEAFQKPNPKPASPPPPATKTSATGLMPASRSSGTGIQPANKPASAANSGSAASYVPTVQLKPDTPKSNTALAPKSPSSGITSIAKAGTSGVRPAVSGTSSTDDAAAGAAERAGALLIEDDQDIAEAYGVLRELVVMATYTFHFTAGSDLTGKILDHIEGPWILIDTRGARRMVNISHVSSIDILA